MWGYLRVTSISTEAGQLTTLPRPSSRMGGHHLPILHPLDAFGVSPTVPHHFSKTFRRRVVNRCA